MQVAKVLLVGISAFALGTGAALADRPKDDPGFNKLDSNNDGYLSRAESAKNPTLSKNFKQADKNGDGKLSRTEYLTFMTKKDLGKVKDKVAGGKDKDRSAATGSSKQK